MKYDKRRISLSINFHNFIRHNAKYVYFREDGLGKLNTSKRGSWSMMDDWSAGTSRVNMKASIITDWDHTGLTHLEMQLKSIKWKRQSTQSVLHVMQPKVEKYQRNLRRRLNTDDRDCLGRLVWKLETRPYENCINVVASILVCVLFSIYE